MPWNVTVADGLKNIVLPNGLRYSAGDTATLSDDEYSLVTDPEALFSVSAQAGVLALASSTGINGYALVNGTRTILTWTAPDDGNVHRILAFGSYNVTSALTGGSVAVHYTDPGGTAASAALMGGGEGAGASQTTAYGLPVAPGTTVTVLQTAAATAGAATLWAEIWAL